MDQPVRFVVSCDRAPQRVRQLRRITAAHLRLWSVSSCADTAKLLVSELVTNAVRYGEAEDICFSVSYWKGEVRIEVGDGAPGRPEVRKPSADEESGRGMLIVEALAEDWGTSPDGTRTWCTIAVPEPVVPVAGFWCEWRQRDGKTLAVAPMPTPDRAIRWARIQMRVIASAIEAPLVGHVWDWLSDGWREPTRALKDGEEFTLPLTAGPYAFVWHARPVRFVPLVGGSPLPHLTEEPEAEEEPEWD
ncbi:ATP-binding protein [Streptomyces lincolnensis]|uniref:ATP-binding protein n=1 Tax=Streptomyces lincolnensis TaxID=1915 RepID=UPI001E5E6250|nr:ATP-binding protein [Streptomyces lincolnensis]MCD7438951.1 ATP-binding protein [Streptomyces lincolnensis]